jgi:predicted RecB family endonuclease
MFSYINTIQNLPVAEKRALVKSLKDMIKEDIEANRTVKALAKAAKRVERESKRADRIAALEAKLAALRNPVGAKAVKANRKPGKVAITKFA